ncbi:hypothetical protein ABZ832_26875 [Streptantibioticus parmotrematis]|uniref:hypothetical protein n=1 Tax=Streptantibioticus parmotrematis TaxID=2873249 RepID=UPI0034089C78
MAVTVWSVMLLMVLALWVYTFVDCVNTPEDRVRTLPKVVWLVVIVLFGMVPLASAAWFAVGRPARRSLEADAFAGWPPPEERWIPPDDNPAFLRSLDAANRARRGDDGADSGDSGEAPQGQD